MLKGEYERQLMGAASPEPVPLGKAMLSPESWGAQAISATPYGHCVDKTGMYVVRPLSGRSAAVSWARAGCNSSGRGGAAGANLVCCRKHNGVQPQGAQAQADCSVLGAGG